MSWLSVNVADDRDIAGKLATSDEYASAQSALDNSVTEFQQAVKGLTAPDLATAERFSSAFDQFARDLKSAVAAIGNAFQEVAAERAYASGWHAGFAAKGDAPQPVVNITFDPGAIALALPDAVRVALEPQRTETAVVRDEDGKLTGIRTLSR
jgi:hypothetical protein